MNAIRSDFHWIESYQERQKTEPNCWTRSVEMALKTIGKSVVS